MQSNDRHHLRQGYRRLRQNLSSRYQQTAALNICQRLQDFQPYQDAKRIALYDAFKGELSLEPLWTNASAQGKTCYFPSINEDKTLRFALAEKTHSFKKNKYGIMEPEASVASAVNASTLDLIFLPLLAFDSYGTRLGFGQGYYDRTLATDRPSYLIGVGYAFQRCFQLEAEPWDVPLHAIVTPEKIIHCKKRPNID